MNQDITLPIMGAIIGYSTNWLAIKMIFKPYEEKRVLGIKVPFTPGVMAKERYRFSKKLGDTLAENVITEEELGKYLKNIKFDEVIKNSIDNIDVDKKISTFINTDESVQALQKTIYTTVNSFVNDKAIANVSKYISDELKNSVDIKNIFTEDEITKIIESLKTNDEVFRIINNLITNLFRNEEILSKHLEDVLGEDVTNKIIQSLNNNIDDIRLMLLNFVKSEDFDFVEGKIEVLIAEGIANIPLASMFGGEGLAKMFTPIVRQKLTEQLENSENNETILEFIEKIADKVLKSETRRSLDFITQEGIYLIVQNIYTNTCDSIKNSLVSQNTDYSKLFETIFNLFNDKVESIVGTTLKAFVKDEEKMMLSCGYITNAILDTKIETLTKNINEQTINQMSEMISNITNSNINYILKNINISKIVEDKINTFEMEEAEKIVLDVVNKELKMITALGGALGFVVGVLSMFI